MGAWIWQREEIVNLKDRVIDVTQAEKSKTYMSQCLRSVGQYHCSSIDVIWSYQKIREIFGHKLLIQMVSSYSGLPWPSCGRQFPIPNPNNTLYYWSISLYVYFILPVFFSVYTKYQTLF